MANECVITDFLGNNGDIVQYTCAEATDIPYGTLLELTDPRTVKKVSGAGCVIAGIAAEEFTGGQGRTTIGVFTNVIYKGTIIAGGSATLGSTVRSAGATNEITLITTLDGETGKDAGFSLETGAASETVLVRLRK